MSIAFTRLLYLFTLLIILQFINYKLTIMQKLITFLYKYYGNTCGGWNCGLPADQCKCYR